MIRLGGRDGIVGKLAVVGGVGKVITGADTGDGTAGVDTKSIEAEAVGSYIGPGVGLRFGAKTVITDGVRDGGTGVGI